jgi:hypothetical protein
MFQDVLYSLLKIKTPPFPGFIDCRDGTFARFVDLHSHVLGDLFAFIHQIQGPATRQRLFCFPCAATVLASLLELPVYFFAMNVIPDVRNGNWLFKLPNYTNGLEPLTRLSFILPVR